MTPGAPVDAVLVVHPFCLDHVGHGNIQRILAIAHDLAADGYAVDLVYQGSPRVPPVPAQYAGFRRVIAVQGGATSSEEEACERRMAAFYAGRELPPAHMRPSAPLTTMVRALLEAEPYAAVVATYAFTAPIFCDLASPVLTVCDVQDVMQEHARTCLEATGRPTTFTVPAETEAFLWRQWDVLVAITPDDARRIRRELHPTQRLVVARHAVACAVDAQPGADDVAFYAGSDNQSNVQAIGWLLEQVWPRIVRRRPAARLRVAGLICRAIAERLRDVAGLELLGFKEDLRDEIAACGVVLAPYLYGSGLKIKVVEAACAGKAIVTSAAGIAGSGLTAGHAVASHDAAGEFADAAARLLGDREARRRLGQRALSEARRLYDADTCYGPILTALRLYRRQDAAAGPDVIAPAALTRLQLVASLVRPARLVVWGNGAHTRALVAALSGMGVSVDAIVDGRATAASVSPEGSPVWPGRTFAADPDDLIVLSSVTFEAEMWADLAALRERGAMVLGLHDSRLLSRGLRERLPAAVRAELQPDTVTRPDSQPAVLVWGSGIDAAQWWRASLMRALADDCGHRGSPAVLIAPSRGRAAHLFGDVGRAVHVLPILESSGRQLEAVDVDGGTPALVRAADTMARASRDVVSRVGLGHDDLVVAVEPSLADCLGLARALEDVEPARRAALALVLSTQTGEEVATFSARRHLWEYATSTLADRVDGRLALLTADATVADSLSTAWRRPVHAIGHPVPHVPQPAPVGVLVLGHVSVPRVRPLLEALVDAITTAGLDVPVAWRSEQGEGARMANASRAGELARMLGVALLDRAAPAAMDAAIAGAGLILVLDDAPRPWLAPVRARARRHAVPVFVPRDAGEVVAALHGVARPSRIGPPQSVPTGEVPGTTLARILSALGPPVSTRLTSSVTPANVHDSVAHPSFLETVR